MDGQTERVNLVIQQFLKNYVAANQQNWVDHLELAKFYYNNSEHSATKSTPFQMVTGKSPIVPITWVARGQPLSDASEEMPMVTQLEKKGDACGRWQRPTWKRHTSGTRILRTSPNKR
jgi:hypothetical protein